MPLATRDKLRQRFLDRHSDLIPAGPAGQVPSGVRARRPYVRSDERAIGYVPYRKEPLPDPLPATLVAFYLPQFHTIPENDEWWGKGFTEWRNVTRALPQFEGHHQPKLPGDLGFYDLRNPEVMREQARLAREYGISAFCFYFYWFGGKTLLETPLRNWLNDKSIDLQFCLCWANEKWSRTWDGRGNEILIEQKHSPDDDIAFIEYVAEYMRDSRYLRLDGKPVLLIYRPGLFPDITSTTERWRSWCRSHGLGEIHLVYAQSFERPDPESIGFDAAVEFPPNLSSHQSKDFPVSLLNPAYSGLVTDWRAMSKEFQHRSQVSYVRYSGVNCGWDNEPRRCGRGRTYLHASSYGYGDWLRISIQKTKSGGRQPIFINAWNEWAEGAILEPTAHSGYAYLEETRRQLKISSSRGREDANPTCHAVIHAWYMEEFSEIIESFEASGLRWSLYVTTTHEHYDEVASRLSSFSGTSEVFVFENRGRDVLPFLSVAHVLFQKNVDVVLKVHTKRSAHRTDGNAWRRELLDSLIRNGRAEKIYKAFSMDDALGIVAPEGHLLKLSEFLGSNREKTALFARLLGLTPCQLQETEFVSGSMFWMRLNALRPFLDADLFHSDFEPEKGQIDGTAAHALERLFVAGAISIGYKTETAAAICNEPFQAHARYPYAP